MANTKVTQHVIANNAIQEAMITNAAVTPDKLHGTLDLSSKSITLPSAAVATTQSASDNSTKLATTAYVTTALANLVDSSPSDLNTLNELAAALNDDASFSSTVTTSIAAKLPLAGGTMTGDLILGDNIKIEVGSASGGDLQIYHDGSNSYISDQGTGDLRVLASGFRLLNSAENANLIRAFAGAEVELYHNGTEKLATSAYGVDIVGTGALKVPVGTTGQRPTAATGQIRWNSTDGALEVYNGSSWTGVGTTGSNKVLDTFTGDGSTTAFTLSVTPANEDALMVFIDGVYQEKGDYSLSNAVLTLDTAPASGEKIAVHTTTASVHDGTSALTQQFTGDGSTTAFTLSQDPNGENNTQVFVNGVYQAKTTYSVSGTTLTFASAPANSAVIEVIMFTVTTLGNTDTVTEGIGNLYHTSARAVSAVSAGNLTGLTVDTNTLSVDATNNRIGIGTTSPNAVLHLGFNQNNIGSSANPAIQIGGTSNYRLGLYTDAEGGIIQNLNGDDGLQFRVKTAGEAMRIDGGTGNVGIGTQAPAKRLHIRDDTQTNQSIRFGNETAAPYGEINYNSTGYEHLYIDSHGTTNGYGFTKMRNGPDLHESITINSDGYVTISRNANEYGLELRSTGTRSGLVLATPNSGNTIKGSLLLLTDNTLRLGTQSVYNIHMNQSGHNTMPNQPYMRAYGNYGAMASNHGTTSDPWNHWAVGSNSGITHSNGVFTVPTAGRYLITYSFYLWINNSGGGASHAVYLYIGSTNVQENMWEADLENDAYSYYDNTVSNSIVYNMSAGDTFKFVTYADTYGGSSHTNMSAYLLG